MRCDTCAKRRLVLGRCRGTPRAASAQTSRTVLCEVPDSGVTMCELPCARCRTRMRRGVISRWRDASRQHSSDPADLYKTTAALLLQRQCRGARARAHAGLGAVGCGPHSSHGSRGITAPMRARSTAARPDAACTNVCANTCMNTCPTTDPSCVYAPCVVQRAARHRSIRSCTCRMVHLPVSPGTQPSSKPSTHSVDEI